MKNFTMNESFRGARKCATQTSPAGKNAISLVSLVLLLFASLSASGCIGLTSASKTAPAQQTTPGAATISVAPGSISFGSVPVGSTASQSVTISNGGGANLTVTQASATAAGVTITGMSFPLVIGAGKQATFDVVFSPKSAGALSGQISIMSDISSSPDKVSLSGTGMAATALLTTNASSLNFGNVGVGKSSTLSVVLTNAGNSNVTVSKVTVSGAPYSTSGVSAGLILSPGQSATLDAIFSPTTAGSFSGSVTVASSATNSPGTISFSGSSSQVVSHSVALTWTSSTSAVTGYHVYRSQISGGPYSILDSSIVAADSYSDSTVQAGLTYYYIVKAVTSAGVESADSTQVAATIP
jgi:hypothetical protein